jgi:hypothetical protein
VSSLPWREGTSPSPASPSAVLELLPATVCVKIANKKGISIVSQLRDLS